jgi:transposase
MPSQHIIERGSAQKEPEQEGIVVPLDLGEFRILKQHLQADGSIEVEVIATTDRAQCPHCQRVSVKVHDRRLRRKRDLPLRGHRIVLILQKRRFR